MPSTYIQSADYALYGLPGSTTAAQVQQASILIDAYLRRVDGLLWTPDAGGNPGWMMAKTPTLTLAAAGAIAPGNNVVVPVTGGIQAIAIGDALVLDRTNTNCCEVGVVISLSATPPYSVTLQQVTYSHPGPCTLDQGLTLLQHKFMPEGRPLTTLAYTPVTRLLSGQGRYGYGRRGNAARYQVDEFNLLASLSTFGGPPAWEFFPLNSTGINPNTGEVWVPAGVMLAYYSEVNLWYVAGYQQSNLPTQIALACAQLIKSMQLLPVMGNAKSYRAGDTQIQMMSSSYLSADSKAMLDPFRAKLFF